ncbi:hypothetical protein [Actinomadura sp. BRA 177]|uniref:hypothetical protein n=1 Tax=Actinomadura sp. BRA 177 TaxID=2745202 RepID=UPI0015962162|nr:hypothetical protein [Actinomadura sp. BRA 177]NVI90422.1 hypothetical protein [Actinomadura sp. BRA 177]
MIDPMPAACSAAASAAAAPAVRHARAPVRNSTRQRLPGRRAPNRLLPERETTVRRARFKARVYLIAPAVLGPVLADGLTIALAPAWAV